MHWIIIRALKIGMLVFCLFLLVRGNGGGVRNERQTLLSYLKKPSIPSAVLSLAQVGYRNRHNHHPITWDAVGGGRSAHWIKETFNQDEQAIIKALSSIQPPLTWTIQQIDDSFKATKVKYNKKEYPFYLVKGVGINGLHQTALGKDAVVQLASQFNYLESPGASVVPVQDYLFDTTQGPQCALEAAAGTLHRHAAVISGKLDHALKAVIPENLMKCYHHGYLEPEQLTWQEKSELYRHLVSNIHLLRIVPQWVMCERSGHYQLQVLTAAPSFQGKGIPLPWTESESMSILLIVAQYEVLAKLAVMRSTVVGKTVPLHLTLLGQGAFENPPAALAEGLKRVYGIVRNTAVTVYVHAYSVSDQKKVATILSNKNIPCEPMSSDQFRRALNA